MDMNTKTSEWDYEPTKFLNYLENREHNYYGKIDISNYFTIYDRLLSLRGDGRFAYLSNNYDFQLISKDFLWQIYEMKINETSFSINESVIVNNTQYLKLEFDSESNALHLSNKPKKCICKYYSSLICDYISSVKNNCNEGEILCCNSYSLIILEGKLIYRNYVDSTEKVVYSVPNFRLTSLAVTDRHNVLWKYSINNSPNSGSNAVFLYNKYYNKCLYAEPYTNEPITYEDCKDKNKYKWYYVNIDGNTYFKSASKENLCIRVNKNRIVLGNCDKNAIIKYIKTSKFIKRYDKCVSGIDDNDDLDSQYFLILK
ncbi:hypothetical protein U3516DRAFT_806176 [Neocallimastix sp. 'constans']